jgi:spermidine synthase
MASARRYEIVRPRHPAGPTSATEILVRLWKRAPRLLDGALEVTLGCPRFMRPSTRLVAGLLFFSGLSALVYQTAWQRSLRLVFGASTAASAAVLAVFLGGLGVGGVFLGRRAERSARPLVLYGNLELGVAVTAAISPFVVRELGRLYLALGGTETLGPALATAVRLFITALSIGPSVVLMGGTLPAAARAVEEPGDPARARLAVLYGANTLGAVTGAVLGTFALFELFGLRLSLFVAALLNALVAIVARSIGRSTDELPVERGPATATQDSGGHSVLAYGVAAGVGFAFLLLEIVWYRLLSPLLGGSTYTFGLVLATALAGIGLGGFLYARRGAERPATLSELSFVTTLEGVLVALPIALGDRIALFAAFTRPMANVDFTTLVASWAAVTALVVFPASLVSGYQFPLLFALLGKGRDKVARQVGAVYAFNTAGSIMGAVLGGFYLIPRLGAVGCFRLVAATLLSLGLVVTARNATRRVGESARRALPALLLAALGAVLVTRSGPSAVWRHEPIGAGRARPPTSSRNELRAWTMRKNHRIAWEADGIETAVALEKANQLAFVVDGKTDGAVFTDRATQAMAGLVAAMVHPSPRRAFVIGLGTGMTAGWLSAVPGMDRVDVAELERSIVEVARAASAANQDVLSRPSVHLHFGDGREILLTSRGEYDIIASEPSNPYRAGISALYTREFYEAVKQRLREPGIFVQWVQGYEIDADTLRTIVRTLRSVFPYVEAWQPEYGDLLFLASSSPRVIDVNRLRTLSEVEPFRAALVRTMLVSDAEGFLSHFVATDALLAKVTELPGVAVNTDDENILDYAFARAVGTTNEGIPLGLLQRATKEHQDRPETRGEADWSRVAELRPRIWLVDGSSSPPLEAPSPEASRRIEAIRLGCRGQGAQAFREWNTQPGEPRDDVERFIVGMGLADAGDERASPVADVLAGRGFVVEAELLRARRALFDKDTLRAMDAATRGLEALRKDALPVCNAARQLLTLVSGLAKSNPGLLRSAVDELVGRPFAAGTLDEERRELGEQLADATGDAGLCVRALGDHVEHPVWDAPHLRLRLRCLGAAHHPAAARARADLVDYFHGTSGSFAGDAP